MKIDRTKALIAGVLITISTHSQASLINFTSSISNLSSSLTGTFTYDTDLDRYSNVNLTYDLANSNVQTIRALTSDGPNSASTLSLNFFRNGRLLLQQGTEFRLSFVGLGGLGVPGTITWSSITDILIFGTQRKILGFQESGVDTFTVTNLSSTDLPPTEPPSEVPLPSTVPLPSALAMFASGLVAFAGYRRRKQQT
jgi:hypothetical protein